MSVISGSMMKGTCAARDGNMLMNYMRKNLPERASFQEIDLKRRVKSEIVC